ncbi:MAG TPA: SRPBCC family protein [Candidatus Angelobacter sp.]|nr:SRPBCC family protein [Candidatus Angelobacter sp.]
MAVRVEKTFQVQQPVERVWAFLSDPRRVATCVPGAQITEQVDDRNYKGAISVKVGPSVTDYRGTVEIVRLDPDAHEIEILGKGQDVRGKGSASMKMTGTLRALENGTEVVSVSELNVVGILAQMGARVINEVSNIMFEQFAECFRQKLQGVEGEPPGAPKPVSAVGIAFSALKATLTGGSKANESGSPEKEKS